MDLQNTQYSDEAIDDESLSALMQSTEDYPPGPLGDFTFSPPPPDPPTPHNQQAQYFAEECDPTEEGIEHMLPWVDHNSSQELPDDIDYTFSDPPSYHDAPFEYYSDPPGYGASPWTGYGESYQQWATPQRVEEHILEEPQYMAEQPQFTVEEPQYLVEEPQYLPEPTIPKKRVIAPPAAPAPKKRKLLLPPAAPPQKKPDLPPPYVRPPYPATVLPDPVITSLTPTGNLLLAFRIGDALRLSTAKPDGPLIQLFARVGWSQIHPTHVAFELLDLYHDKPPFLSARYERCNYKSWNERAESLERGALIRIFGRVRRGGKYAVASGVLMAVSKVEECDWEKVEEVKRIVLAVELEGVKE